MHKRTRGECTEAYKRRVDAAFRVLCLAGLGMQPETGEGYAASTGELLGWLKADAPTFAAEIIEARFIVLQPYYDERMAALFASA